MPLTTYTAGEVLTASSLNANLSYLDTKGTGLTLIKTQTIGTTVATVEVTGAFSSTYDDYLITVTGGVLSAGNAMRMILGATTAAYYNGLVNIAFSGGGVSGAGVNNGAIWNFLGYGNASGVMMSVNLQGPNLAKFTYMNAQYVNTDGGSGGGVNGYLNNTTQYTAFTISPGGGTMTGGTIRVYGYQKS